MFGFGPIFMFLFWGFIIYGAYVLFRRHAPSDANHAIEILKERYAKGELTKDQFETIRKDLQ